MSAEEAKRRGVFPSEDTGASGGGKNDALNAADGGAVGVFGGEVDESAASEKISDGESLGEIKVEIAGVFDGDRGSKGGAEKDIGQFEVEKGALEALFAGDLGIK